MIFLWEGGFPLDPGGKAADSDSAIRRFDPFHSSHAVTRPKIVVNLCAKSLHSRGFLHMAMVSKYPKIGNFSENFPKVSGPNRRNSRF